jgi:hypothetical protein
MERTGAAAAAAEALGAAACMLPLVAVLLQRSWALLFSPLPVSAELLGDSRSPRLCLGGESNIPLAAAPTAPSPGSCKPGTAQDLVPAAAASVCASCPGSGLLPCAACMPALRSRGASSGDTGSCCCSCPALPPLLLLPVRGCDLTSRLGVSSWVGAAVGQGVSSISVMCRGSTAAPSAGCPAADCMGVQGDASPCAGGVPAVATGLLFGTGVMVDRASRGTAAGLCRACGVLKLACCCCTLLLLLPSMPWPAVMPAMRPR